MRLYEYEAKRILSREGIPVPRQYGIVHSAAEIEALELSFPVMMKAMVLVGGRGKAGGIRKAESLQDARSFAREIFAREIKGYKVVSLLLEDALSEAGSCYVGVTMNPMTFNNVVMVSARGGVDIEEVAAGDPQAIMRKEVTENEAELPLEIADELAEFLRGSLDRDTALKKRLIHTISAVYEAYQKYDCKIVEINPLIITQKCPVAADAKMVLDDNALYRQRLLLEEFGIETKRHDVSELTPNEQRAAASGFPYVDLLLEGSKKDPEKLYVGLVPGGAGYGIFSIDEVANIGDLFFDGRVVPINFMDSGGGPSIERVVEMFNVLMDNEMVDVIITSRFGGISSCDIFIRGLVQCLRQRYEKGLRMIPVYGRMVGTDLPNAKVFLEKAKAETPQPLRDLDMVVGNRLIMAGVIRNGIEKGFQQKKA